MAVKKRRKKRRTAPGRSDPSDSSPAAKVFNILIVDDEKDVLDALYWTIKRNRLFECSLTTASSAKEGLHKVEREKFDAVLSDYRMPGMNGVDFLTAVRDELPDALRIIVTGFSELHVARDAINKAKVDNFIEKPWNNAELRETLYQLLTDREEELSTSDPGSASAEPSTVSDADDALKMVYEVQRQMARSDDDSSSENVMILEFASPGEFNQFSFSIKKLRNVQMQDVQITGGKYIATLAIMPASYERIR